MDKYKNKYRIPSARAPFWDYGWNAAYFVTICTQNREHYFGEITTRRDAIHRVSTPQMQLSEIGQIAHDCWLAIPEHFPFATLGNHIVMPNHVHGIVVIDKPDGGRNDDTPVDATIETRLIASLSGQPTGIQQPGGFAGNKNPMLHDNLSKIIRWYKGRTSYESHKINPDFAWQPRFHDHIIRDEKSFHRISDYIINNLMNWREDKFYTK